MTNRVIKDDLARRIANEMAASDASFADTAREITASDVIGIDHESVQPDLGASDIEP